MVDIEDVQNTLLFSFLIISGFLFGICTRFIWRDFTLQQFVFIGFPILEIMVSIGTLIFFALQLNEIKKDRHTLVEINQKERKLQHITKQLDYYSDMKTFLSNVDDAFSFNKKYLNEPFYMPLKHEMYAKEDLKLLMRKFSKEVLGRKVGQSNKAEDELAKSIIKKIEEGYIDLTIEYRKLTNL
jgi:hypothetical protein